MRITTRQAEKTVKAPFVRRAWYRMTFGKWGELTHKRHYMVKTFHSDFDGGERYENPSHVEQGSSLDPVTRPMFNFRCSTVELMESNNEN